MREGSHRGRGAPSGRRRERFSRQPRAHRRSRVRRRERISARRGAPASLVSTPRRGRVGRARPHGDALRCGKRRGGVRRALLRAGADPFAEKAATPMDAAAAEGAAAREAALSAKPSEGRRRARRRARLLEAEGVTDDHRERGAGSKPPGRKTRRRVRRRRRGRRRGRRRVRMRNQPRATARARPRSRSIRCGVHFSPRRRGHPGAGKPSFRRNRRSKWRGTRRGTGRRDASTRTPTRRQTPPRRDPPAPTPLPNPWGLLLPPERRPELWRVAPPRDSARATLRAL